ncbi:hypothetical protein EC880221_4100, partial [Escherichia coli 88.0221]
MQIHSFNIL